MLEIYKNLFSDTDKESLFCCSWKSNDKLEDFLNGHGDLDLFVPNEERVKFEKILLNNNFKNFKSYVADFPFVEHYYGLDQMTGKLVHLHVYYKIVTGDSQLKQYIFPIDNWLKTNKASYSKGLYKLTNEAQLALFSLRHFIKIGSLASLLVYLKDKQKYLGELKEISITSLPKVFILPSILSQSNWDRMIKTLVKGNILKNWVMAQKLSSPLQPYSRYSPLSIFFKRPLTMGCRIWNKAISKRKKYIPNQGIIISICGLDGTGKSTQSEALLKWFSKEFDTKIIHVGKPNPTIGTLLLWLPIKISQLLRHSKIKNNKEIKDFFPKNKTSLIAAIRYIGLAYERLSVIEKAVKLKKKGYVIITDRYPSNTIGKMDSPRIVKTTKSSFLIEHLFNLEHHIYNRMSNADILFYLEVPVEVALQRNNERKKFGKETENELRARYIVNQNLDFKGKKIVKVDAQMPLDSVSQNIKSHIWNEIRNSKK